MPSVELVFDTLECMLDASAVRADPHARPIAFELLDDDGEVWSFDPRRPNALFAREPHLDPALTITCRPETLLRLVGVEALALDPDEPVVMGGDPDALDHLITHISKDQSPLATRARRGTSGR